ncbi:chemotaxis protein [uncultured Desulfuromonas sp.]|uniref:chemotaxis protein n=1 Tax=uncultured Desulfuromonas sp. TaxID=181013 RepID=UPI002AABC41C|nr:chemotaxis protein [uncultured Desulfuromonas sp.]
MFLRHKQMNRDRFDQSKHAIKKVLFCLMLSLFGLSLTSVASTAEELQSDLDHKAYLLAQQCRDEVVSQFELLLSSGRLTVGQLFDTFYIPIPNTDPQKYRTQYDTLSDEILRPILDKYLAKDPHFVFCIVVDRNGYLPTHNTHFAQPLTGNAAVDSMKNRTKRIFNDRTGLAAARNLQTYLLQRYSRDTGEQMSDLSIPITISKRHWGAVRIGYKTN